MADLSRRWDEPLIVDASRRVAAMDAERLQRRMEFLWDRSDPECDVLLRVPNFFEDLAVMERSGAIPFKQIKRSLGGTLDYEWEHWEPTVLWLRGDEEFDLVYENWERLVQKMRRNLRRRGELPALDLPNGREEAAGDPSGTHESDGPSPGSSLSS